MTNKEQDIGNKEVQIEEDKIIIIKIIKEIITDIIIDIIIIEEVVDIIIIKMMI